MRKLLAAMATLATITAVAPVSAEATPPSHGKNTITVTDSTHDVRTFVPVKKRAYDRVSKAETDIVKVDYTFKRRVLGVTITMREMYPRSATKMSVLDWVLDGTVVLKGGTETRWGMLYAPGFKYAHYTDPDGDPRSSSSSRRCASKAKVNTKTDTVTLSVDFRSCLPAMTSVSVWANTVGGSRYKLRNGEVYAPPNFKDTTDRVGFFV